MPDIFDAIKHGAVLTQHYKVEFRDPKGRLYHVDEFDNANPYAGTNAYLNYCLDASGNSNTSLAWYVGLVQANQGVFTASMSSSTNQTYCTLSTGEFTAADVGSSIIVQGAGASGADLITTIATYSSATLAYLTASCATTVSTAKCVWGPRTGDTLASHSPWAEGAPYSGNRPTWTPNGAAASGSISNSSSPASFTLTSQMSLFGAFMANANSGTSGTLLGMGLFTGGSQTPTSGSTVNVTITCSMT